MFKPTVIGRVQKLLDYYNRVNGNHWLLVGNSSSWDNEDFPPIPSDSIDSIVQPIKFFRVTSYAPCFVSNTGDIQTGNGNFQSINTFNAVNLIDQKATNLAVNIVLTNTDIVGVTYRSVGLCNSLNINPVGVEVQPYSSNIIYQLEGVSYLSPQTSNSNLNDLYQIIIEF